MCPSQTTETPPTSSENEVNAQETNSGDFVATPVQAEGAVETGEGSEAPQVSIRTHALRSFEKKRLKNNQCVFFFVFFLIFPQTYMLMGSNGAVLVRSDCRNEDVWNPSGSPVPEDQSSAENRPDEDPDLNPRDDAAGNSPSEIEAGDVVESDDDVRKTIGIFFFVVNKLNGQFSSLTFAIRMYLCQFQDGSQEGPWEAVLEEQTRLADKVDDMHRMLRDLYNHVLPQAPLPATNERISRHDISYLPISVNGDGDSGEQAVKLAIDNLVKLNVKLSEDQTFYEDLVNSNHSFSVCSPSHFMFYYPSGAILEDQSQGSII